MKRLSTLLFAAAFALSGASALAADPPKADADATKAAAPLKKPADGTQDAWYKMSAILLREDWPCFARHRALMEKQHGDPEKAAMKIGMPGAVSGCCLAG